MSPLESEYGIPTAGKKLIVVAAVKNVLHFRIFDRDGRMVVGTDETKLKAQAGPIEGLRKQLSSLWPPHALTDGEKAKVIPVVTSIVGHTPGQDRGQGCPPRQGCGVPAGGGGGAACVVRGDPGLDRSTASGVEPRVIVRRGRKRVVSSRGGRRWSTVR
jgi:hypothetical protein